MGFVTGHHQNFRLLILIAMDLQKAIMGKFLIWMLNVSGDRTVTVAFGMLIVRNHH